jgi:predicted  nucleic acid-binding Zn-ribbon protein
MPDLRQTLRCLRSLQELDRDLYRIHDELRRLPQELGRKRGKLDLESARAAEIQRQLMQVKVRIKEIEDLTTSQRQRVRKLENQASESRGDAALLAAFQHEIRTLRRDIGEAEEEGLELVETAERLEAEKKDLAAAIGSLEQEFREYSQNVEREIQEAEARAQNLEQERERRAVDGVAAEVLDQYEKLLEAREGQAMAELEGRICQGCYVTVPSNIYVRLARSTELVLCPSCGRILYLPGEG